MAKYSALILFVTLAVFWTTAVAHNRYQDDVIEAMSNWATEEMRNRPEPYKTRITNKMNEAKNMHWDSLLEYGKYASHVMGDYISKVELHYNRYQNDLIEAITNWTIEELHDAPEDFKTRVTNVLNEAKDKDWDSIREYIETTKPILQDILLEIIRSAMRSKRSVYESGVADKLRKISRILSVME